MKSRGIAIVERMRAEEKGKAGGEGGAPDEHMGVAKDLHDAIHGHDIAGIAEVLKAIKALGHGEPDGDEPGAEGEPEPE